MVHLFISTAPHSSPHHHLTHFLLLHLLLRDQQELENSLNIFKTFPINRFLLPYPLNQWTWLILLVIPSLFLHSFLMTYYLLHSLFFSATISSHTNLTIFKQAIKDFDWCKAIKVEIEALEFNHT